MESSERVDYARTEIKRKWIRKYRMLTQVSKYYIYFILAGT